MPRLLLATHGGVSAEGAARVAALLAQRLGARLDVVCVLEPLPPVDFAFEVTYPLSPQEEAAVKEQIRKDTLGQLASCGIKAVPLERTGPAATEIAAAARSAHADLVVLGLGPHQVIDRALDGETAVQLVQQASTAVLAVPSTVSDLPRRAVAAIDFTPTSVRAVQTLARVLQAGDELHLVHVRMWTESDDFVHTSSWLAADEAADPLACEHRLAELAATLPLAPGVSTHIVQIEGRPAPALLEYVERVGADLLALGSHGHGLWKRLTIGSVSSKILRVASCSVLAQPLGSLTARESGSRANVAGRSAAGLLAHFRPVSHPTTPG